MQQVVDKGMGEKKERTVKGGVEGGRVLQKMVEREIKKQETGQK